MPDRSCGVDDVGIAGGCHTGFESSDPASGALLDSPVVVITLVFTGDAEPVGEGFEILEPSGEIRQPTEASSDDGRTWALRFDPPLSGGTIGVRWMVKAPDTHPIDGAFSFTVPDASPDASRDAVASPGDDPGDVEETLDPEATAVDTVPAADIADPVARYGRAEPKPTSRVGDYAWRRGADSAGALLGALAIVGAHLFDGHTVTKGNRLLTGATDVIHVAGGAVWAGGLVMLVSVVWRRHREGHDLRAYQLAIRFSVVAIVALVVVGSAGVVLTIIVLDSPSELWSTEWGRVLIAKTIFVGVAALAGGYNHKVLIPQLDAASDGTELARRFRNVVTGEGLALVAVAISTALLIGAAS